MTFSQYPYERPDTEKIRNEMEKEIREIEQASTAEEAMAAIDRLNKIRLHFITLATIVEIRYSINTKDAFYEKEQEFFDEESPKMEPCEFRYCKALLESPFKKELEEKYGKHLFDLAGLQIRSFREELVPLKIEENKLTTEYQKLYASAEVPFEGEVLNIPGLEKRMQSPDREERQKAYKAYAGFFRENESRFDAIYDSLVKNRDAQGKIMGFSNFIPLGYMNMQRLGYDWEDVKAFREQVRKDLVPVCSKLLKKQADRIGVEKLYFYDEAFQFPDGNPIPIGTKDELVEKAGKMYDELSQETGEYFRFMRKNDLLDLEAKPGKAMGGYCTFLPDYHAPFIFSNFNGTSGDVDVLTHESGHAFQSYMTDLFQTVPEYANPSSEACEIHSMSMEFFTYPWMESFFGENTEKYKEVHTSEALTFIPYGVLVDEFQHRIYEKPEMTPDQRKAVWHELEGKYLPERDYAGEDIFEKGAFFFQKLHIFMYPFYYIDYTLASMAAFEYYGKMQEDREKAWESYLLLCRLGGSLRYTELLKKAGLCSPFEEGSVKKAIKPLVRTVLQDNA